MASMDDETLADLGGAGGAPPRPTSQTPTDLGVSPSPFKCEIELNDDLIGKIKKLYGLTSFVANLKWAYKLALSARAVQDLLEAAIDRVDMDLLEAATDRVDTDDAPCLCNAGFEEWLQGPVGAACRFAPVFCGNKRPLDSDDLPSLLYEALACCLLWQQGTDLMEKATIALNEKAKKPREPGSLDLDRFLKQDTCEFGDESDRIHTEMTLRFCDGPQQMMDGILNGDADSVLDVLGEDTFHFNLD